MEHEETNSAIKKHKPEEITGKLREAEIVLAQSASVGEMCRRLSVSEQTYRRVTALLHTADRTVNRKRVERILQHH